MLFRSAPARPQGDLPPRGRDASADGSKVGRLAEQIERRILEWLRDRVGVPTKDLDRNRPFAELGVDSMAAVDLSCELENWLKIELSPMTAWQYPTPAAIARHLAIESLSPPESIGPEPEPPTPTNDANLDQLLDSLDNLSESEAAKLLDMGEASNDTA